MIRSIDEVVDSTVKRTYLEMTGEAKTGISSGWKKFDEHMGGFMKQQQIIVAGRPAMGKTTFSVAAMRNIMRYCKDPYHILWISFEVPAEDMMLRIISESLKTPYRELRSFTNPLDDKVYANFEQRMTSLKSMPVTFIDKRLDGFQLEKVIRKKHAELPEDTHMLIVMDQIGKIRMNNKRKGIGTVSAVMEEIKNELFTTNIILSQIHRAIENKYGRPGLENLKDSGSLEEDADVVFLIYRPEYYGLRSMKINSRSINTSNMMEVIVAKNRNGFVGSMFFECNLALNSMREYDLSKGIDLKI